MATQNPKKIFFLCSTGTGTSMKTKLFFKDYLERTQRASEFELHTASLMDPNSLNQIQESDSVILVIPDKESTRQLIASGKLKSKHVSYVSARRMFSGYRNGLLKHSDFFSKSVMALVTGKRIKKHRFF